MAPSGQRIAIVIGNVPTVEELDQFSLLAKDYEVSVITSESICGYLSQTSRFQDLQCIALMDHNENPTYLPGLEHALSSFDLVIVKERTGLYAFQAVKAKWKHRFRLAVWVDNLSPFPGDDISQMRTIRQEVNNAADVFLVQSKGAELALSLEGIESQRIQSFKPWVEQRIERTKKGRAESLNAIKLPESCFTIAHIGQIEWEEGLANLVYAVKQLKQTQPKQAERVRLIFCGIGSYGTQLRSTLVELGIDDQATFLAPSRQAFDALWQSADALYLSSTPARDRLEGDPYRLMAAMAHGIPILASRTPLIEEYCGKHRFDFCANSVDSLAKAISKLQTAHALRNDIVKKNLETVSKNFNNEIILQQMKDVFARLIKQNASVDTSAIDHQVIEVEAKVSAKQYLSAIDLIESIFQSGELPVHHKANLYRLIGDCFAKLGDSDAAKDAYIKAIELDAYSARAYIGLGTVGLVKGSNDIAVIHFQKAVSLAPEDEMANLGLGLAFQGMDELKEAGRWVVKALQVNPENTAALYTLVKIAYDTETYDAAETALESYMQRHNNDHAMLFTLGGIQFKQGRFDQVITTMEQIISSDPLDSRAHGLLKQAKRAKEQQAATSNG